MTGDASISGQIDGGIAIIQNQTQSLYFVLAPTAAAAATAENGTIVYDLTTSMITQDGTFNKLGESIFDQSLLQQYGEIYCLSGNSTSGRTWVTADASAISTSTGLLGVGINDNTTRSGLLLRGFINISSNYFSGTQKPGAPLYLSITAGRYSFNPPTSNGEIVRIVGYFIQSFQDENFDLLYLIYFHPDNTWIEL